MHFEIGGGMSFVHSPSHQIMLQIANWVLFLPFTKNSYRLLLYFMRERDRYQLLLYSLRALHWRMVCMFKILLCLLWCVNSLVTSCNCIMSYGVFSLPVDSGARERLLQSTVVILFPTIFISWNWTHATLLQSVRTFFIPRISWIIANYVRWRWMPGNFIRKYLYSHVGCVKTWQTGDVEAYLMMHRGNKGL